MTYDELKVHIESDPNRINKLQSIKIGEIKDIDNPRNEAINKIYETLYNFAKNLGSASLVVSLKWSLQSLFPEVQDCLKRECGKQAWDITKIRQTMHGRYGGKDLYNAFKELKKGRALLKTFNADHPNHSLRDLINCLNNDSKDVPSVYYSKSNPDYVWNFEGNNRIIMSKTIDAIIGLNNRELLVDLYEVEHDISDLLATENLITNLFENHSATAKFSEKSQNILIFSDLGSYQIPTKKEELNEFISSLKIQLKSNFQGRCSFFCKEWL